MSRHMPNFYAGGSGNPGEIRSNSHGNLFKFKQTGSVKGMARGKWVQIQDKKTSYDKKNADELNKLRGEVNALKNKKAAPAAKPKPKPKGDQQIDPVKHSPEITGAQKIANSYMDGLKDKKSPWAQAQNDVNASAAFNSGGKSSSAPDAQDFADKYKLNLISSGATQQNNTDFTSGGESHLTSADILKRDRQMYG